VSTQEGDWIVKGFIDIFKRVYQMPGDTKVVSKVLELFLLPRLASFGERNGYSLVLPAQQNFYPDATFISQTDSSELYAVDVKSTYRVDKQTVNGMTLGAFTGYFRDRASRKNVQFPYSGYRSHLVLGVIYSKNVSVEDTNPSRNSFAQSEMVNYTLDDLDRLISAIHNIQFFVQPKYKIASARPGSGNTRNIGSVTAIDQLLNGTGPCTALGEDVYDDYWMHYLNADMGRKIGSKPFYNNLTTYAAYKQQGQQISIEQARHLDLLDTGAETSK